MKKILSIITLSAFVVIKSNAQLSVYSNGYVGIATTASTTPASTFSVKGGMDGYEASVLGTRRGIYGISNGHYLNWSYGVYGKSNYTSASFQCGVAGIATISSPQSSCRTYGVIGLAGNASSGWNYGIYGGLDGSNNGAGVYGTSTHNENGSYVDGRYAGYFNGATKVRGNLTVTGSIQGVLLNQVSDATSVYSLSDDIERTSVADKLSMLSATKYYAEVPGRQAAMQANVSSDSVSMVMPENEIQVLSADRIHYGLDIDQLKEFFPELVYEQEGGSIGVNYIEMIPILIQAINHLREEVKILKSGNTYPYSERSGTSTTSVVLSTDGKMIGTKRTISK